jgi:hypothetical protein
MSVLTLNIKSMLDYICGNRSSMSDLLRADVLPENTTHTWTGAGCLNPVELALKARAEKPLKK